MTSARMRTTAIAAATATLAASIAVIPLSTSAQATTGTVLTNETFKNSSVLDSNWKTGGEGGNVTCLTASINTEQQGIPGCPALEPGVPPLGDTSGSGALRLTSNGTWETGWALYDVALPFNEGLVVEFDQYQYGGSGADGIGFFLADGSAPSFTVGADGGSLGFAQRSGIPGVPQGYYGVGLDSWGNFARDTEGRGTGCATQSSFSSKRPATITTRGKGNGTEGYCWQKTSGTPAGTALSPALRTDGTVRTALNTRQGIKITIDPTANANSAVNIYRDMGSGYQLVMTDAMPAQPPATIKFGFLASAGNSTDIHEITNVKVSSIRGVPKLTTTVTQNAPGVAGGTGGLSVNVSSDATNGSAAQAVTVTSTMPTGVSITATPSGTGWNCSASTASAMSCTRVATPYIHGALPAVAIPIGYGNGFSTDKIIVSATATAADAGPGQGETALNVTPVAQNDVDRTNAAVPVLIDVQANDLGNLNLASITVPAKGAPGGPVHGTAAPTPVGEIIYTPDTTPGRGWSGIDTFNYTIKDIDLQPSTATVTVTTLPVARPNATSTNVNTPVIIDVLDNDNGNFTKPSSVTNGTHGTASINNSDGTVTYTPTTPTFSGIDTFTYTVTDAASQSATATVTVNVSPYFGQPVQFTTPVGVNFDLNVTSSFTGTGTPNWATLAIATPPTQGQGSAATIPGTPGGIRFTAPTNWSGAGAFSYTVEHGSPTPALGVAVYTVTPVAHPDSYTVGSGATTTFDVLANDKGNLEPSTVIVQSPATHHLVNVNPDGTITYTAKNTFSGPDAFTYVVYDRLGQPTSAVVSITVNPTTRPSSMRLAVDSTETVDLLDGSTGDINPASLQLNETPSHGTWTWNSTARVGVYTSTDDWSGVQNLTYRVCDRQVIPACVTSPLVITTNAISSPTRDPGTDRDSTRDPGTDRDPTRVPASSTSTTIAPVLVPGRTPSASQAPTVARPAGVAVLSGAARANAPRVKVSAPLLTNPANAPEVVVLIGTPVALVVNGLPANMSLQAGMSASAPTRAKTTFALIGKTRSNAAGQATVPAFKASRAGLYTIRLATPAGKAYYLKVKVSAKKPSPVMGK